MVDYVNHRVILYWPHERLTNLRTSPPGECPTGLQSFAVQLRRMTGEFNRIVQEFAQAHGLHHTDMLALIAILDGADPTRP